MHSRPCLTTFQNTSKFVKNILDWRLFFNSLLCALTECGKTQSIMFDVLLIISACYSTRLFVWISQKGKSNDKLANIKMFDNLECVNTSVIFTAI